MPNRIQSPTTRPSFGLIAWLEPTKISLPLKGVECRFAVCGDLLSVEIDQIFHQNSSRPMDCLYTFPLPGSASVCRCEMHLKDRVIRAKKRLATAPPWWKWSGRVCSRSHWVTCSPRM